jgi:hypothetical protein
MRNDKLDTNLKNKLEHLKQVPGRNPQVVARGKANFLRQAVSLKANQPQKRWINYLFPSFSNKEHLPMLKPIMAVILGITILFAGTAGTVYAAQGSLPDQALYKVKTWSEDLLLAVTRSPQAQLEQNLNFADRRILEIAGMQAAGTPIPQQVLTRLQAQLNQALNLAAGMGDQQMIMELERIRLRTEAQLQMMSFLMAGDPNSPDPVMALVRTSLQQQLQMASQGKTDVDGFRMQVQNQIQNNDLAPSQSPGTGQGGPNYSLTTTPMPTGQHNGNGSSSDNGNGPYYNYLTTTPMQNETGQYSGQKTPAPGTGNKP